MGPTLACPSAVREYTAFLREHKYVNKTPMNIPMITDREELMTTLIATVEPVERGVTVTVGAVIQLHHQHE